MSTDAVRAALAELVACHTEEAGLTMSMVANRADYEVASMVKRAAQEPTP